MEHLQADDPSSFLMDIVGGSAAWEAMPLLDLSTRTGSTGYIDFVSAGMFPSEAPMCRGTDCIGRQFLSLRCRRMRLPDEISRENCMDYWTQHPHRRSSVFVVTIFQRFTDDQTTWVHCPRTAGDSLSVTPPQQSLFRELCTQGSMVCNNRLVVLT